MFCTCQYNPHLAGGLRGAPAGKHGEDEEEEEEEFEEEVSQEGDSFDTGDTGPWPVRHVVGSKDVGGGEEEAEEEAEAEGMVKEVCGKGACFGSYRSVSMSMSVSVSMSVSMSMSVSVSVSFCADCVYPSYAFPPPIPQERASERVRNFLFVAL